MSTLAIDDFKARLIGGGARNNLFKVTLANPSVTSAIPIELASFMVKGASLPSSVVGQIDVPFRGRQLKVMGDRTFENWTTTIFNDIGFEVKDAIERWMNSLNAHANGTCESINPADYQADFIIDQLDRTNSVRKTYIVVGAFPVNLSAIDLDYGTNDQVQEYTCEWAYQYWTTRTTS